MVSPDRVGSFSRLDHVSIGMASLIGEILEVTPISYVHVRPDALEESLERLGEFDSPRQTPLHIELAAFRTPTEPAARAGLVERDGLLTRVVYLPIFTLTDEVSDDNTEQQKISVDELMLNRYLEHELRHAVDFSDHELMEEHDRYMKRESRKFTAFHGGIAAMGVASAETVLMSGAQTVTKAAAVLAGSLIASVSMEMGRVYKEYCDRNWGGCYSYASYRNNPLEVRAYGHVDALQAANNISSIIELYGTATV